MAHCGVICMQICGFSLSGLLAVTAFLFTTTVVHAQEIITVFGSRTVFQHAGVPDGHAQPDPSSAGVARSVATAP